MRTFLFFIVAALCIGVLVMGNLHWQSKLTAAGIEGKEEQEKIQLREKEAREARIQSLDPNLHPSQTLIDYLLYKALTQQHVVIAVVGSDGAAGSGASHPANTWPELLEKGLRAEFPELENLRFIARGYEGYTTTDFINSGKINDIIPEQPDLVIFETALLNNYHQSIGLEQTVNEMETLVSSLQMGLPNAKIILLSPNPIINSENKNNLKQTYLDYVNASTEKIMEKKWSYINSHEKILTKIDEDNIVLADIMTSDRLHLNDGGHSLWFQIIMDFLKNDRLEK